MIKLSELIGKPLLELSKAAVFTVGNVFFDYKKNAAVALEVICGEDDCEYKYLGFADIYKIGDAVTIKNSSVFRNERKNEYAPSPLNKLAYTQDGIVLGTIKDVVLDNEIVKSYLTDDKELLYPVISVSSDAIIFNDSGKTLNLGKPRIIKKDNRTVKIIKETPLVEAPREEQVKIPATPDYTTVIHSPLAAPVTKYDFLLGKRADKDIFSNYGKLIVGTNELITNEIILAAKNEGKLVQLAMHSR